MPKTEEIGKVQIRDYEDQDTVIMRPDLRIFDHATASATRAELNEACQKYLVAGRSRIVIDLSSVMVIDSSGLSVLIGVVKKAEGVRVSLVVPAPVVRHFVVTKLDKVFPIYADIYDALDAD